MFKKLLLGLVGAFSLVGCGDDIVVPEQYSGKSSSYNVVEHSVFDKNGLMAVNVKAYIDAGLSAEQRAATAIEVARKWQDITTARMVFATLYDPNIENAGFISRANLYVSKCGLDEKSCNDIQWEISYADNVATEMDKQISDLWYANRDKFQRNNMTDEVSLKNAIANHLSILPEEVSLFNYETWEHSEKY